MRTPVACLLCLLGLAKVSAAELPEVIIDPGGVPPAALEAIHGAVEAITRLAQDQDGGEVSRLRRRAHDATLSALETQGYFSPVVTLEVGEDIGGETWDIIIEPGERTEIRDVDIRFRGHITRPEFSERADTLRAAWPLTKGMPFINGSWSDAKVGLLDDVSRKDFYFARYVHTQATIMADEARADLALEVDSGPRVRMGELQVLGLRRVPRKLIDRYVNYEPGRPYDQDLLDGWQQALNATTFFRGAFVTLSTEDETQKVMANGEVELPVRVEVTEGAARIFRSSLGADSDRGVQVEGLYRQNVVFGQPVWIETGAGIDRKRQRAYFDVHLPPSVKGYRDSVGVLVNNSEIENVRNTRAGLGWTRFREREGTAENRVNYQMRTGVVLAYDKTHYKGADKFTVPTLLGTWQWLRRDVNDIYDPREGNLIEAGVGAGVTLDAGEPFARTGLRLQQWWPIGEHDVLSLRGEVGKVWSKTDRLPEDFGYRTGGARSIRGYRYMNIGTKRGDATIGADALAVLGIEYTYYFTPQIGMNVFVDAGDAADSFSDMDWHVGYGAGVSVRTPAGPFSVDLAYGQRDRRLRLHFSLGIAF